MKSVKLVLSGFSFEEGERISKYIAKNYNFEGVKLKETTFEHTKESTVFNYQPIFKLPLDCPLNVSKVNPVNLTDTIDSLAYSHFRTEEFINSMQKNFVKATKYLHVQYPDERPEIKHIRIDQLPIPSLSEIAIQRLLKWVNSVEKYECSCYPKRYLEDRLESVNKWIQRRINDDTEVPEDYFKLRNYLISQINEK